VPPFPPSSHTVTIAPLVTAGGIPALGAPAAKPKTTPTTRGCSRLDPVSAI